jgi:hypothetical protein
VDRPYRTAADYQHPYFVGLFLKMYDEWSCYVIAEWSNGCNLDDGSLKNGNGAIICVVGFANLTLHVTHL